MNQLLSIFSLILGFSLATHADGIVQKTKRLFHAGDRASLNQYIQARTIPQNIWDNVIFGSNDSYLQEYRKGLYGAEAMGGSSLYGTYQILGGIEPWMMVINIKSECLTDQVVFPAYYYVNTKDHVTGAFNNWYWRNKTKLAPLEKQCLTMNSSYEGSWSEGIFYNVEQYSEADQLQSRQCTQVLTQFFKDEKLKLVGDNVNPDSWYLRDRSCIESITGTPDELFALMTENKIGSEDNSTEDNLFGGADEPGTTSGGSLYVALSVLAETSLLNKANVVSLNAIMQRLGPLSEKEILKQKKDVSFSLRSQANVVLVAALRAAKKAIATNQVAAFQGHLKAILTDLVKRHGLSCRGRQGVPKKYLNACENTAFEYGQKLMAFFLN